MFALNKTSGLNKNATKEKKQRRRPETNVPQIQEWTLLQKDDCEREMQMPVRKQGRRGGWIFSWLFKSQEVKTSKEER